MEGIVCRCCLFVVFVKTIGDRRDQKAKRLKEVADWVLVGSVGSVAVGSGEIVFLFVVIVVIVCLSRQRLIRTHQNPVRWNIILTNGQLQQIPKHYTGLIPHIREEQATGGSTSTRAREVLRENNSLELINTIATTADIYQCAYNSADHIAQKPIGTDGET